mgnify:FL=1
MEIKKEKVVNKHKGICIKKEIISGYDWRIIPWKNPDGSVLFYLNRLFKGKTVGTIICSKKELKDLKKFIRERKLE